MPYCPKCDMEFIEGIAICSDCGQPLLNSKEGVVSTSPGSDLKATEPEQTEQPFQLQGRSKVYQNKQEQYENYQSSASAFLLVGTGLLIVLLLSLAGILRFPVSGVYAVIYYGVLIFMGVMCAVIWRHNQAEAKKIHPAIRQEADHINEIIQWFVSAHSGESIDETIADIEQLDPAELTFRRFALILDYLITAWDLPDPQYADMLCELIYSELYEKDE